MKNKLLISVIIFLFLIPFRLPISILFVKFFKWLIESTTTANIPLETLITNVIITKIVYNIVLSAFFIRSIELFSRERMGRKAKGLESGEETYVYWWIIPISILLLVFIVIDCNSISSIMTIKPAVSVKP